VIASTAAQKVASAQKAGRNMATGPHAQSLGCCGCWWWRDVCITGGVVSGRAADSDQDTSCKYACAVSIWMDRQLCDTSATAPNMATGVHADPLRHNSCWSTLGRLLCSSAYLRRHGVWNSKVALKRPLSCSILNPATHCTTQGLYEASHHSRADAHLAVIVCL
jgi:hypothetical protein